MMKCVVSAVVSKIASNRCKSRISNPLLRE